MAKPKANHPWKMSAPPKAPPGTPPEKDKIPYSARMGVRI